MASIVSAAYADAKAAQDKCSEIVSGANGELTEIMAQLASFKSEAKKLISKLSPTVEKISVPDEIDFEVSELPKEPAEPAEPEIEKFSLEFEEPEAEPVPEEEEETDADFEETEEEALSASEEPEVFEDAEPFEDVSSFDEADDDGDEDVIVFQRGYNGNNTSFKNPEDIGFDIFDFDEE